MTAAFRAVPLLALVLTALGSGAAASAPQPKPLPDRDETRRMVFAHYMVCCPTYGDSVEAFQREIREAQAAGIDGFALNCGGWSREPHYPRRSETLYEAAEKLGTGFKLFFSADLCCGLSDVEIREMVTRFGRHPNQLRHQGKVVLSTFAGEGHGTDWWREKVLEPLREAGLPVFFVPYFYPRPITELPDYASVAANHKAWAEVVDGMFYFGAAGLPEQLAASNAAYARHLREVGKLCMASYTPVYWGAKQPNLRYYETRGGEGTELQWRRIIESRPQWVEIVTWNDWGEASYVSPAADPEKQGVGVLPGMGMPHRGYLELSRYFIEWFKTGKRPPIRREGFFAFYRVHPKSALPRDREVAVHGKVQDILYVTTMLRRPARLRVTTGGRTVELRAEPGLRHHRVPFRPGPQRFELLRGGAVLAGAEGLPIRERADAPNLNPTTVVAYAR